MLSSLEIAQTIKLKDIGEIAATIGLEEVDIERYGNAMAKLNIRPEKIEEIKKNPKGRYILVTATTPTPAGEGKTTTSIGLTQGLVKLGKKAIVTLRQPSLGPVFGIKGGAAGAGYSQVLPMEQINLGLTGDISRVESAHNLAAAMLDNYIFRDRGGEDRSQSLDFDLTSIQYRRVMDMNDRALRELVIGLGDSRINGVTRKTGFDITAASELMAILALAEDLPDLKERIGRVILGRNKSGKIVTVGDISANGAMAAIMREAVKPNLVQTTEGGPALMHAGPFANIAHGCSSIIGDKLAQYLGDYVVTEAGFASDLGAEKFLNIKCRQSGMFPNAIVVVTTVKALKIHGGVAWDREKIKEPNVDAVRNGLPNLDAHITNMRNFGVPVVVALNRFASDTDEELQVVMEHVEGLDNVTIALYDGVVNGGDGSIALAEKVVEAAESNPNPEPKFTYELYETVESKILKIAQDVYGAASVSYSPTAKQKIKEFVDDGYGYLPICMAKTHLSFSHDPTMKGAPSGFELEVEDIRVSAGAGFIYPLIGSMLTMPGLPPRPAAVDIDIDKDGKITGLF